MKKWIALVALMLLLPALASAQPRRVVSLMGSLAEAWALSGGALAGATQDAVTERNMALGEGVRIIGTTKAPSLELILDLEPDLVLYSTEIAQQAALAQTLKEIGVETLGYDIANYRQYMDMMAEFCAITGRADLLDQQRNLVAAPIEAIIHQASRHPLYGTRTALLLRAYSTGVKAKNSNNMAGEMLRDLGLVNVADAQGALMENLSLEAILELDPDYIFVVTMGDSPDKALEALKQSFTGNPAWQGLTAVREGRFIMLDRTLFHLKPNARWVQGYQTLYDLLYAHES